MARGELRPGRTLAELSDVIIAEWFRILPDTPDGRFKDMDLNALTAAFNLILGDDSRCQAIADMENQPIRLVVPLPPKKTRAEELESYLEENDDFRQGMGAAVLFGCGR
jgi:hypothetical protein